MKSAYIVLIVTILLVLAAPVFASSGTAICIDGYSPQNYGYQVSMKDGSFTSFRIGTCDPNLNDYSYWLMPESWHVSILGTNEDHSAYTEHGTISTATGECDWSILWTGPAVQSATFGFYNPNPRHDVGWAIDETVVENWSAAVGYGEGPVHAPTVPEPASFLTISSALVALGGTVIRKRR